MEEMLELLEKILKGSVPAVAVGGCIFLFGFMKFQKIAATPREEILFMSKKDKLIKDTYAYLILFIVYSLKNKIKDLLLSNSTIEKSFEMGDLKFNIKLIYTKEYINFYKGKRKIKYQNISHWRNF